MTSDTETYLRTRTALLSEVRTMLVQALKLDVDMEDIDPDAPLFGTGLGLDSVDAVEVVVQLETRYGLTLVGTQHVSAVLRTPNIVVDTILRHRAGARS